MASDPAVRDQTTQPDAVPQTESQFVTKQRQFVNLVCRDSICRLASRCNNDLPCRIFDSTNGDFNVCFFVEFPHEGTRWVVRVPILHMIEDVWDKVQSEVATMFYIRNKTTIPIPRVCAFGQGEALLRDQNTLIPYVVLEYVPGEALDPEAFVNDTRERRDYFYIQIVDILAQLRSLKFSAGGTLRLDPDGGPDPVLGPYRDNHLANLWRHGSRAIPTPTVLESVGDFALFQLEISKAIYNLPAPEQELEGAQKEVFALHMVEKEVKQMAVVDGVEREDSFVLTNLDLWWPNIIVDSNFKINAIIDWEWTSAVPRKLHMPPTWITGKGPACITERLYRKEFPHFHRILQLQSGKSDAHRQLAEDWDLDIPNRSEFAVGEILRQQSELTHVFYKVLFPKKFEGTKRDVVASFFAEEENKGLAVQAEQQWERSKRYTQYLKDNALFVPGSWPVFQRGLDGKSGEDS